MTRRHLAALALALSAATLSAQQRPVPGVVAPAPPLEHYLEALRQQAQIPGMSGAVLQDGEIIWERGFGFQNQEQRIAATPDTPYLVGGLSQTLAAAVLLQCVEQRRLDLDRPLRDYGLVFPEPDATLRRVLNHSSTGGVAYRFAPDRYALLNLIAERCVEQPYRLTLTERIINRLAMRDTVPGADLREPSVVPTDMFEESDLERYSAILQRMAVPYRLDRRNRPVRVEPMPRDVMTAAGGLVTTVRDYAKFDAALDTSLLWLEETRTMAWARGTARDGAALPTGLGWFVQAYQGEPVVWQFGVNDGYSSLVVKLPQRRLTFVLFANSDRLSAPFELESGNLLPSLFASIFLRLFT